MLADTADVARFAGAGEGGIDVFADDTAPAVESGACFAAAGLVERAAVELDERFGEPCTVLVTGGGGPLLHELVRRRTEPVADLVLRGLAVVAVETQ